MMRSRTSAFSTSALLDLKLTANSPLTPLLKMPREKRSTTFILIGQKKNNNSICFLFPLLYIYIIAANKPRTAT